MTTVFVIPAHDEKATLEKSVASLHAWATARLKEEDFAIVISENASADGTDLIGSRLANRYSEVVYLGSNIPGKGGALKWGMSVLDADRYVMMDADLSVDLDSVACLLDAAQGDDALAIASRRMPGSEVDRPLLRKLVTAVYARLLDVALGLGVRDAQCGCKILSRRVRDEVLPEVEDDGFFFDTELLARAKNGGFHIVEVPVRWEERGSGRGSSVRILRTSFDFLRKLMKLRGNL